MKKTTQILLVLIVLSFVCSSCFKRNYERAGRPHGWHHKGDHKEYYNGGWH